MMNQYMRTIIAMKDICSNPWNKPDRRAKETSRWNHSIVLGTYFEILNCNLFI